MKVSSSDLNSKPQPFEESGHLDFQANLAKFNKAYTSSKVIEALNKGKINIDDPDVRNALNIIVEKSETGRLLWVSFIANDESDARMLPSKGALIDDVLL